MKFKETRYWSSFSVRTFCIRYNLFTCGTVAEYEQMLCLVDDLYPDIENVETVAALISTNSEDETVAHVMYLLLNDCIKYGFEIAK